MASELDAAAEFLKKNLGLENDQLAEIVENFQDYREQIADLREEFRNYKKAGEELGNLNSQEARLNYEMYETFMAVHTNSIRISGSRSALKIAGQTFSKDIEKTIEELLAKYLMIEF